MKQRLFITAAILLVCSWIFFLLHIHYPVTPNFDEFHYVPAAKQFLELKPNQNWEHPPLGKQLMAVGIALFGDQPLGWRFMSTWFGALTLVGMYFLGWVLLQSESAALWIACLTLFNQVLYVQARIGMLDTFMFGFLVWALVFFSASWKVGLSQKKIRLYLGLTGVFLGLSSASKWFGFVPWIAIVCLVLCVKVFQYWKIQMQDPSPDDWYREDLWKQVNLWQILVSLVLVPVGIYFLTFLPYLAMKGGVSNLLDILKLQTRMWEGQQRVVNPHPYMSHWMDWPFLSRPIWYAFDRSGEKNQWVRGVLLLGNPLIMVSGVFAVAACVWRWITERSRVAFLISFFYLSFYGCWMVIPRKVSFYYYYYPAAMVLSLALGLVFFGRDFRKFSNLQSLRWGFLGACLGLFIYFFPLLSALQIPTFSFRKWMWLASWI
ncbi:MAG: phospholipid carrier-dependent glycosyltransferase [Bdellovibrionia bacterium]